MSQDSSPRPRIAVIGVHGVADQMPSDTARTVADLLARAGLGASEEQADAPSYSAFEEHTLRIPVMRVPDDPRAQGAAAAAAPPTPSMLGAMFAYSGEPQAVAARLAESDQAKARQHRDGGDASLEYMAEQLSQYQVGGKDLIYNTLRLEGVRTTSKVEVDVYEMYWADLSRFVGNWLRWVIEFYQLLFNLCMLGRKSLGFARAQWQPQAKAAKHRMWWAWPVFAFSQVSAERLLALFIPNLNLYLLGVALGVLPLLIPEAAIPAVIKWFMAAAGALVSALSLYLVRTHLGSGRRWPWLLIVPSGALAGLASSFAIEVDDTNKYAWLLGIWWLLPVAAILWTMAAYQKSRSGAWPTAFGVGILVSAFYGYSMIVAQPGSAGAVAALLHTAEWVLIALVAVWSLLYLASLLMTISGKLAAHTVPAAVERDAVKRAVWTTNLTMVLPGMLVLLLTVTLWSTLINLAVPEGNTAQAAAKSIADSAKASELWQVNVMPCRESKLCVDLLYSEPVAVKTVAEVVHQLLAQTHTPLYGMATLLVVLAAVLAAWAILPAALLEVMPRTDASPDLRRKAAAWLGESLSAGFRAMRLSGEVVRWTFIALIPVGATLLQLSGGKLASLTEALTALSSLSLFVGGWLMLALIASKGPLRWLALGLGSVLDVALDVINWMRLKPLQSNTRSRICARFYSQLQHIEQQRSVDGRAYSAIIILAHSQGTVITADLLRYLRSLGIGPKLPIYLFTMGSPLRQLYGLRFPHLYGWACDPGSTWPCRGPDPQEVGVTQWVNAYASGDYVGRYLWHSDATVPAADRWKLDQSQAVESQRREFCVGAGAHTHYWDGSWSEVACVLDQLIALAARDHGGRIVEKGNGHDLRSQAYESNRRESAELVPLDRR